MLIEKWMKKQVIIQNLIKNQCYINLDNDFQITSSLRNNSWATSSKTLTKQHEHPLGLPQHSPDSLQQPNCEQEIGEMTGTISYIHLVLPLNIPSLKERANQYIQKVWISKRPTWITNSSAEAMNIWSPVHQRYPGQLWRSPFTTHPDDQVIGGRQHWILEGSEHFSPIPARPNSDLASCQTTLCPDQLQIRIWDKWFVSGLIKDIFSTAMGLYNTHKLNKLKGCLEDVEDHQSQLVCFTLDACRKLNQTSELAELLKNLYSHLTLADPTYTLTELGISQCKLDDDCHKVLDALKTAQVHCLSMDIMSPEAIKEIFNSIVKHAPNTEWGSSSTIPLTSFKVKPPTMSNLNLSNSSSSYRWPPPTRPFASWSFSHFLFPSPTQTHYFLIRTVHSFPFPEDQKQGCTSKSVPLLWQDARRRPPSISANEKASYTVSSMPPVWAPSTTSYFNNAGSRHAREIWL